MSERKSPNTIVMNPYKRHMSTEGRPYIEVRKWPHARKKGLSRS